MFVYLDETGDTGFKFDKGSSRYFVVTILLVQDPIPLYTAIDDLRKNLHFRVGYEFKFSKTPDSMRQAFLRVLVRHDVLIRCLVVDKPNLDRPELRDRETFYTYVLRHLLQNDGGRLQNARLILDQREKDKRNQQHVAAYLRKRLNADPDAIRKIRDIRYHESHRDNLLQAVDMVSGAINASYTKGDFSYRDIVQSKLDDIWEL